MEPVSRWGLNQRIGSSRPSVPPVTLLTSSAALSLVAAEKTSPATRDFTVAVFVAHRGRVLLQLHRTLGRWLPPGGHIEPNELPDEAALREVWEETGVRAELIGSPGLDVERPGQPRQLCRPAGVQLATIRPGHEHIDLVYFAIGQPASAPAREGARWFSLDELEPLGLTEEVRAWCIAVLAATA